MPTGYTAGVADGTVGDFATFAMQCARAFGALVEMRDSPVDAPIPDEFIPSPYYAKRVADTTAELHRLLALTDGEAGKAAQLAHEKSLAERERSRQKRLTTRERYRAMLDAARAWIPPTPDHTGLKDFMVKQLEESLEFDCGPIGEELKYFSAPDPIPGVEWRAAQIEQVAGQLRAAERYLREEQERARHRTLWVQTLRASLRTPA